MADHDLRSLSSLHRLRRIETDAARRELSDTLAMETMLSEQDSALGEEMDGGRQLTGYFDRDAFFAWWARLMAERARLAAALNEARVTTAAIRENLAHRRVAETAAEEALAAAVAMREAETARRDQLMLEDVSRALSRAAAERATG